MGAFFVYILKSSVCLALFYLFYRLLLSKETFHRFNRIALLGVLVLSCLLPLLAMLRQGVSADGCALATVGSLMYGAGAGWTVVEGGMSAPFPWKSLMLLAYAMGILFFLIRLLWSLARVLGLLRICRKEQLEDGITLFVHRAKVAPFSWMKVIVVSEEDLDESREAILAHERAHIMNRHSWDLLLTEACVFVQWFNPAAWLLKQEMQAIHEYEADGWVIANGIDAKSYQLLIIKKTVGERLFTIANSFSHGSLKKRIGMMIRQRSNPWARLKCLYVLPLAGIAVAALARPEVSDRLDGISEARFGQLVSVWKGEKEDVLKYSFRNEKGLPTVVEMKRKGDFNSQMVDSVLVVVDEEVKGYGQEVLKVIPGERIKSVMTVQSQDVGYGDKAKHGVIKITTKEKELENNPLIVVDGEVKGYASEILETINVDDIASVTVVKNQDITFRLYGDKGKDGVILITMKK